MPETFVVDGRGQIAYKHVGPLTPRSITEKILPAVRGAQGATQPAG
jgi:cytochrome c biogenesis protein CcmG/thiol:disulfide interchange protein DsbE